MASAYAEKFKREQEEAQAKVDAATKVFWPKLQALLEAKGHKVEMRLVRETQWVIEKIDGLRLGTCSLKAEKGGGYGAGISGKIRFIIGYSSEKKAFFQSVARGGDFNYEAIVTHIEYRIVKTRSAIAQREKEDQALLEGRQMRERLVKEFFAEPRVIKEQLDDNTMDEYLTTPTDSPIRLKECEQGGLKFIIEAPITDEEKLRELLAACKKIGLCG